jgi:hypothetical protein
MKFVAVPVLADNQFVAPVTDKLGEVTQSLLWAPVQIGKSLE